MSHFFRNSVLVFVSGWVAWFLLDKPHMLPWNAYPARKGTMLHDFQLAFDMLRAGQPKLAFVVVWHEHWLLLSLLGGGLVSIVAAAIQRRLTSGRRTQTPRAKRAE